MVAYMQSPAPPTSRQLTYLRRLAFQTGTTFTSPRTRREASRQIAALLDRPISSQMDLDLDLVSVRGGDLPDENT